MPADFDTDMETNGPPTERSARKRWMTPRVIVSKAEHTDKVFNTHEYTFGVIHRYGPS